MKKDEKILGNSFHEMLIIIKAKPKSGKRNAFFVNLSYSGKDVIHVGDSSIDLAIWENENSL